MPNAIDRGPLSAQAPTTPISVTVVLSLSDPDAAEQLLTAVSTPGNPQYRQFLTSEQFVSRFAPAPAVVAKVIAGLQKYNLTVEKTTATTLRVTGTPDAVERAFSVSLHSYEVPAQGSVKGYNFHAPVQTAAIPAEISGAIAAVVGLDSRPALHPHVVPGAMQPVPQPQPASSSTSLNPFGELTVSDFATLYDVTPLYKKGVSGSGRTIGVMSLANFTPSDVFAYWSALGLKVDPNRIKVINVDGGPGAPSDASGSIETTLDIEQSGGLAPGADMLVYLAPNTTQAFVDIFAAAIEDNKADSLSISWGEWEWLDNLENSPATDPLTGRTVSSTQAIHELLVRAALQGQSVFTAAGDGGAYDLNRDLGCNGPFSSSDPFSCSLTLSVDYPASDSAITAAGGTTLPGTQEFCLNAACTPPFFPIVVPHEQVWGWDYLEPLCTALGLSFADCGIQYAGGGGGVSITFKQPLYQALLPGVQLSQPGQVYQAGSGFAQFDIGLFFKLPAFYPGRNVPDVSANADPETGYAIYYTSSSSGFSVQTFFGGTSFVAPQMNGVAALLGQEMHGRLGLLNYPLYLAGRLPRRVSPLNPIAFGDNWFYKGSSGYNPGAGLGTLDVAQFAEFLKGPF